MGNEECSMGFFLKLLPSAAIINGEKNRNAARRNKVFQREVNVTFGILPQIQKAALTKGLTLAIPEIVYGSHDTKVRIYSIHEYIRCTLFFSNFQFFTAAPPQKLV